jgi:amino acid transporter
MSTADPSKPEPGLFTRVMRKVVGPPRDLRDRSLFHRLSLIAFLAWVGLGADGLSSSAYGPEECFKTLKEHTYLAIALAFVMAATVTVISIAYRRVIEAFPSGGGGYLVATKLLGERAGVVSGSALLVDYVLTITISIAAACDALFSFLPPGWLDWKLSAEVAIIALLTLVNLRGVRESVLILTPFFLLFLVTHAILIGGGILIKTPEIPATLETAGRGFKDGLATLGAGGVFLLFLHAYSLGGGTYTGIEAVSNGLSIMREPRVETGKRTMTYMAVSLAITASGLLLCYLLWQVGDKPIPAGKTMNAVLAENFVGGASYGPTFVILLLLSEGAILVVAAQTGFVDGPRVLSNMAIDSWVPRRFGALSERLTTRNGILLMGAAALGALLYTGGVVHLIVVMYSINVFLTFSMTELAMCKLWIGQRRTRADWKKQISIHVVGLAMCLTILTLTVIEKFDVGGWITLSVTAVVIGTCFLIRRHYNRVNAKLATLYRQLLDTPRREGPPAGQPETARRIAAILVGGYGGLGIHTFLSTVHDFPDHFKGVVFLSVGVIDSREFKGEGTADQLKASVQGQLDKFVAFAQGQGVPATSRLAIGTDAVAEAEKLCLQVAREFPQITFFAGKIIFEREHWYQGLLHNETAYALQKRLQWAGRMVVVVPAKVT